jgi:hypothetical protein
MPRYRAEAISRLNLHLPARLRRRLDEHLWDERERCVPRGSYQRLLVQLLTIYLNAGAHK